MESPINKTLGKLAPGFMAGFDSGTAFVRSLGNYLKGKDFTGIGIAPDSSFFADFVTSLAKDIKEVIYSRSGATEAIKARELTSIDVREFTKWVCNMYPQRKYPAIFIGSANGAVIHLAAALGVPWLPQTFLIPVKRPSSFTVDEPKEALNWAEKPAESFLKNNPELQLHHLWDPNQDRLMLSHMTYFRLKYLQLDDNYKSFIQQHLIPGGRIYIVDCRYEWPVKKVAERHYFQFGGAGGNTIEELFGGGSQRVEEFLNRYGSNFKRWNPPKIDEKMPEAEWGFEKQLEQSIQSFALQQGFKAIRISFKTPESISPFVADIYREWYSNRRIISNRLVVDSFIVHDPYWTIRTGSIPLWMKFNKEESANLLKEYITSSKGFEEIYLMLFSHGTESVGLVPIAKWEQIISQKSVKWDFLGVNKEAYSMDFGGFVNYNKDFQEKIKARYPLASLGITVFEKFAKENAKKYKIRFKNILKKEKVKKKKKEKI